MNMRDRQMSMAEEAMKEYEAAGKRMRFHRSEAQRWDRALKAIGESDECNREGEKSDS